MVTLIDIDEEKIRAINAARSPVAESGLNELLAKTLAKPHVSSDYESVKRSYLSIIALTHRRPGPIGRSQQYEAACLSLGHALRCNSGDHVVRKAPFLPAPRNRWFSPLYCVPAGDPTKIQSSCLIRNFFARAVRSLTSCRQIGLSPDPIMMLAVRLFPGCMREYQRR